MYFLQTTANHQVKYKRGKTFVGVTPVRVVPLFGKGVKYDVDVTSPPWGRVTPPPGDNSRRVKL
jgi:hypothetical protein